MTRKPYHILASSTPTIVDVARRAGVSPATVSNVLGGTRGVRESSRQAVQEAVSVLGYRSNHIASSLRLGRSKTVGVLVPNLANEYFSGLVTRWEQHAARDGFEIMVASSGDEVTTQSDRVRSLIARNVDGLIVVPADDTFGATKSFPVQLPPTVLVDRAFGHPNYDSIASDSVAIGREGTSHLIEQGHTEIALVTAATNRRHLCDRLTGYRRALKQHGLQGHERVVIGGKSIEECRSAIEQELRRPDRPTAIFATTVFSTLGAIKAIQALDISFPKAISLVGFERSEWMTVFKPCLTTVVQDSDQLALRSWNALIDRMTGSTAKRNQLKIPVELKIRESVLAPRQMVGAFVSPSGDKPDSKRK